MQLINQLYQACSCCTRQAQRGYTTQRGIPTGSDESFWCFLCAQANGRHSVGHLERRHRLVGVVAHQQRGFAVWHVEGNGAADPLARAQSARLKHGISGALNRGLEEPPGLVEDLEVVRVVIDGACGTGQFHLDAEVLTRGWWHLAAVHPRMAEQ